MSGIRKASSAMSYRTSRELANIAYVQAKGCSVHDREPEAESSQIATSCERFPAHCFLSLCRSWRSALQNFVEVLSMKRPTKTMTTITTPSSFAGMIPSAGTDKIHL
eukprot:scaffold442_cov397-Prasinococcus_capsulatus_cf.AAC.54